jgi:hypothetical protein
MKKNNFLYHPLASLIFLLYLSGIPLAQEAFCEDAEISAKEGASLILSGKDIAYDIYYQLSDEESAWVEGVKISGTKIIVNFNFLAIRTSSGVTGYIRLDSVKAIIPTGLRCKKVEDSNKR